MYGVLVIRAVTILYTMKKIYYPFSRKVYTQKILKSTIEIKVKKKNTYTHIIRDDELWQC